MKALIVLPFVPVGKTFGGHRAVMNMIDYLRNRMSLTLVFPCRHHELTLLDSVRQMWPEVGLRPYKYWENKSPLPFMHRFLLWKIRYAKSRLQNYLSRHRTFSLDPSDVIVSNSILTLPLGFESSEDFRFYDFVASVVSEGFDIVQTEFVDFIDISYFLPDNVKKVFVHHELRYVRVENEMSLFSNVKSEQKRDFDSLKVRELSFLGNYDAVITLTENDRRLLSEYIPGKRIFCSPAVIPVSGGMKFTPCGYDFAFVGASSHNPNLDGMLWFCHEVLPVFRDMGVPVKVYVVGKWDEHYRKALSSANPELDFVGFIEDLESFLKGKISVVPIRIGSGMRIKILEAVNAGSPFVTTSKGVEGQNFANGEDCLISDDAADFAASMMKVAGDVCLQKKLAENASLRLNSEDAREQLLERRFKIYEQILNS